MNSDWETLAVSMGYGSYEHLLRDLYINDQLTMKQISKKVGASIFTISKHMEEFGIQRRRPGGMQNLSFKRWRLFRLDQRFVFATPDVELEKLMNVDRSTIYKFKREFRTCRCV